MILFIVLTLIFICILLFPFLIAKASLETDKQHSLIVKSSNVRDPRYFAKTFRALMDKALAEYDGNGRIRLSKDELLIEPPLPPGECRSVVYSGGSFFSDEPRTYLKEVYCKGDTSISAQSSLRAIACDGSLILKEGCSINRWADGEQSLSAVAGCNLGISATSAHSLSLDVGCRFRRLYAPEIVIGVPEEPDRTIRLPEAIESGEILRDLHEVQCGEKIEASIVSKNDFVVGENALIFGSVKSRKRIRIKRGARILGNLIADGDLVLEDHVDVEGIVFSQRNVYVGPYCKIGRAGRIKSLVAKGSVTIAGGSKIFGYISGELEGETLAPEDYYSVIVDKF